jgi:hypothetical protein
VNKRLFRGLVAAAGAVGLVAAVAVAPASAQAGWGDFDPLPISNLSPLPVIYSVGWCPSGDTYEGVDVRDACSPPDPNLMVKNLQPGQSSAEGEDVDGIKFEAGCVTTLLFEGARGNYHPW